MITWCKIVQRLNFRVASSGLEVFAHNIETVERLTPFVRDPRAKYRQTLKVLEHIKKLNPNLVTKSSIMLGLGKLKNLCHAYLRMLTSQSVHPRLKVLAIRFFFKLFLATLI